MSDSHLCAEADQDCLLLDIYTLARPFALGMARRQDVDDIVQDVAAKCLESLRTNPWPIRPVNLEVFVWVMVRNQVVRVYRKRRRTERHAPEYVRERTAMSPGWMAPDRTAEEESMLAFQRRLLSKLSYRCREAYYIVRREGATYEEAGARLGVSPSTIHGYIVDVQARFRQALEAMGLSDGPASSGYRPARMPRRADDVPFAPGYPSPKPEPAAL